MQLLIRILIILLISPLCNAEIYKWTDEHGRVHYGERPSNPDSEKVDIKSNASTKTETVTDDDSDRREKQRKLLDAYEEERAEKKRKDAKAKEEKHRMKQQCAEKKDYLKKLKAAGSYYSLDDDGNRVYLSEEEHKNDISELEKYIRKNC